jgi:hypothetical protein
MARFIDSAPADSGSGRACGTFCACGPKPMSPQTAADADSLSVLIGSTARIQVGVGIPSIPSGSLGACRWDGLLCAPRRLIIQTGWHPRTLLGTCRQPRTAGRRLAPMSASSVSPAFPFWIGWIFQGEECTTAYESPRALLRALCPHGCRHQHHTYDSKLLDRFHPSTSLLGRRLVPSHPIPPRHRHRHRRRPSHNHNTGTGHSNY